METASVPRTSPEPAEPALPSPSAYPIDVTAEYPRDGIAQWRPLVQWLLVFPHALVVAVLGLAATIALIPAAAAILITGRYPRSIFDFVAGVLRWSARAGAYGYLMTDEYAPFSLADDPAYPVRVTAAYPEQGIARWRVIVQPFLAIPHWIALTLAGIGAMFASLGAAAAILFTGRYPPRIFAFIHEVIRWSTQVSGYSAWMTERYPPRSLQELLSRYGLIALLLVMPVYYGIQDIAQEGTIEPLAQNLITGLSNGAIWALVAIGYTLVYGIIELINFAHGEVFMIGAFVAFGFWGSIGLAVTTGPLGLVGGLLVTLVVAMLACGSLNVMIERVAYRPLRNAPKLAPLITAIGFSFILQNVGLLWLGGSPYGVDDLIESQTAVYTWGTVTVTRGDILAVGATIPLLLILTTFVARSRLGKAMRATAQDPEAAKLLGINVDVTISLTFLLGGMMAGAAGIIYALYQTTIWYLQGFTAGLIAFTAAVMGGIGNLKGAVAGGLIIGCIQQISDFRISPDWTPAIVFAYLVLIMVFRPQGLFGEETREAG